MSFWNKKNNGPKEPTVIAVSRQGVASKKPWNFGEKRLNRKAKLESAGKYTIGGVAGAFVATLMIPSVVANAPAEGVSAAEVAAAQQELKAEVYATNWHWDPKYKNKQLPRKKGAWCRYVDKFTYTCDLENGHVSVDDRHYDSPSSVPSWSEMVDVPQTGFIESVK